MPKDTLDTLLDGQDHDLTPEECLQFGLVDELFVPHPPEIKSAELPSAGRSMAQGPTDEERLFQTFLTAFGTLQVRNRIGFGQELAQWFRSKVKEVV